IGPRPIDQHIKGFKALGAQVTEYDNSIVIEAPQEGLHGARIFLDMVSVGATINIILAAVRAEGTTIIENAAKEPEIIDLATFLNNMGAKIRGVGTQTIRIIGVPHLRSTNSHIIIPDRIEAGTYLSLAGA
ncbi:UDP-N-acetylglucosamine 1-carboxyvinyltransferase, partial [Lactobacillus sp. XV13L]|nr:UDP-N-acetylglucosamine 1-carboxyvinyltransferase [Lactobacillus sp. XV13L]